MKIAKVTHDRENCIGCGACAAIAPDFWTMNDDGKADLIGGIRQGKKVVKVIKDKDIELNKEAADSCPVEVIKVEEDKN
ncbi:MAG: ferredoxin [archaeon]